MVVFVPKQKSTVCTSTTGADDTTPPIPATEAIKTECDDSTKVDLFDFFPFFNPSSGRDHFGWSGSWPAGTSPPPPPLLLVQATNKQKLYHEVFWEHPVEQVCNVLNYSSLSHTYTCSLFKVSEGIKRLN